MRGWMVRLALHEPVCDLASRVQFAERDVRRDQTSERQGEVGVRIERSPGSRVRPRPPTEVCLRRESAAPRDDRAYGEAGNQATSRFAASMVGGSMLAWWARTTLSRANSASTRPNMVLTRSACSKPSTQRAPQALVPR